MTKSVSGTIRWHSHDATTAHFNTAFGVMTVFNILFIAFAVSISVELLRLAPSASRLYFILVAIGLAYNFLNGSLWLAPDPWGRSIAAATGVGNMGIAPFELFFLLPFAYPIVSAVVVLIAGKRLRRFSAPDCC
jgi:hypothetical protein